jgi:hypothetical protein
MEINKIIELVNALGQMESLGVGVDRKSVQKILKVAKISTKIAC